jgi:hypothetical protein
MISLRLSLTEGKSKKAKGESEETGNSFAFIFKAMMKAMRFLIILFCLLPLMSAFVIR